MMSEANALQCISCKIDFTTARAKRAHKCVILADQQLAVEPQQSQTIQQSTQQQPVNDHLEQNLGSEIDDSPVDLPKPIIKSKIELLCEEAVKLSNEMRSLTINDTTFNKILMTVLTEKVVSAKLNRSEVNQMVDLLTTTTDQHSLSFLVAKSALSKRYANHSFTANQRKVIDDLGSLEVNITAVQQQLVFSRYYDEYLKLMLKYNLASNRRSRHAVEDVMKVLKSQEFDRSDQVKGHPCTTTEYIIQRLKQQHVWMIVLFHVAAVLFIAVMLQILYNYYNN
jgi:hypothetical protein